MHFQNDRGSRPTTSVRVTTPHANHSASTVPASQVAATVSVVTQDKEAANGKNGETGKPGDHQHLNHHNHLHHQLEIPEEEIFGTGIEQEQTALIGTEVAAVASRDLASVLADKEGGTHAPSQACVQDFVQQVKRRIRFISVCVEPEGLGDLADDIDDSDQLVAGVCQRQTTRNLINMKATQTRDAKKTQRRHSCPDENDIRDMVSSKLQQRSPKKPGKFLAHHSTA